MMLPERLIKLPADILSGTYIKPQFFLCETNKEKICKLETTETKGVFKFNSLSELSFDTARVYNDIITGDTKVNPFYDKIEALRLIYVEGFGYFELQGPELISDGIEEKKSCKAYSLEYTLAQKYLNNFYVNMGTVESLEVLNAASEKNIIPITLYNPTNPKLSLLHLVLSEIVGWKIGHVDASLWTLSRQFEVDRESVYDFLMNEVCEKFNCYIVFDTIDNTINIYAESLTSKFIGDGKTNTFVVYPPFAQIGTVSVDGYKTTRWAYNASTGALILEDTPESGAHIEVVDGALSEWETDVFISFENLAQEVNINYDADSIKTRLTVTYGDDYGIHEVNLGLPYLTDISYYYTVDWMGQDLYDAYTKYLQKSNQSQSKYTNNSQEILRLNDCIAYEENRLSLEYSLASVNASTVGTYYTRHQNLDGSYYYSEVSLPSEYVAGVDYYSNVTTNVNEEKVSDLYEVLKKYFYAYFNGEADKITEALEELDKLADSFKFMQNYTIAYLSNSLKIANSLDYMDSVIRNFLDELWIEIGRTPLKTLYLDPYKAIQETNIKAGWSNKSDSNYGNYYPVTLFIPSIEVAISKRDKVINNYLSEQNVFTKNNAEISNALLMRNNFTEAQLIRLSAFLREDELHLDDIVETSADDLSSSFKIKQDAMESGRIELQKICQPQLQFSMSMANIYALPEFEPIIYQFQLGNVIKVCVRPDYVKQSRLLQVDINFDDFSDFSCEFGELTSLRTQSDIHADLLSQAITAGKSVATNSSYWTRGSDTATSTDLKIQQGLLDATTQIKAIDGTQGVVIDKYGIKLQKVDPTTGAIDPKQAWLVNNMILMSDDGFKTSRSALGQIKIDGQEVYGFIADAILAGYIEGSKMVGGTISSSNYQPNKSGTHFDLVDGDFDIAGGKLIYDTDNNKLTLSGVTIEWDSTNAPPMSDLEGLEDYLEQLDGRIQTYSQTDDPSTSWSEDDKTSHVGDLWLNPTDGVTRRWDGFVWEVITDSELKELAETKAQIFTDIPTVPYYKGDLWVQGLTGDILHCVISKSADESYDEDDWEISSKYTDDTSLNTFITDTYATDLNGIAEQIDKKSETWYQEADPSKDWDTDELKAVHVGDLWFNTKENKSYRYNASYEWDEIDGVPDDVYDAIDGKSTIYVIKPSSQEKGDLLIPNEDFEELYEEETYKFVAKKIYRCTETKDEFIPKDWVEVAYTDDARADEAYTLADTAKGIADNAKAIGDTLVNGLGFKETEITGEYVISPVIAGGTLLIGNETGTYAQITTEGQLICTGAKLSGTIEWDTTNTPSISNISGLNDYLQQLDGRVQIYSQTSDPSVNWSEEEKESHIGDIWLNLDDGITRRWNGSAWEVVTDSELKELAETKAQIFTDTPTTPYYVGDLWVQGSTGDILHCITPRSKEEDLNRDDWVKSSKYTDNTVANEALEKAKQGIADAAEGLSLAQSAHENINNLQVGGRNLLKDSKDVENVIGKMIKYAITDYGKDILANGMNIVISFDAKSDVDTNIDTYPRYNNNGNEVGETGLKNTFSVTTEWKRYSAVLELPAKEWIYWSIRSNESVSGGSNTAIVEVKNVKLETGNKVTDWTPSPEDAEAYTDSKVKELDDAVSKYLGWDGKTIINDKYVISPYLGGGYLNITNTTDNSRVIIDPNNLTENNYIFQVHNGTSVTMGVDKDGNAIFNGEVTATSGIVGGFEIGSNYISSGSWKEDYDILPDVFVCTGTARSYTIGGKDTNGWVFGAGDAFGVTKTGALYATNANITGKINGGSININDKFIVDKDGNVTISSGTVDGYATDDDINAVNKNLSDNYSTTTQMNAAITQTAEGINSEVSKKVGSDEIISKINQSAEGIKIDANKLNITASDLDITVDTMLVQDTSGNTLFSAGDNAVSLAGWRVDSNSIFQYGSDGTWDNGVFMCTGSDYNLSIGGSEYRADWAFGAGGKFGVTHTGKLYASNAVISGSIYASGGNVGCWNINSAGLWTGAPDGSTAGVSFGAWQLFTSTGSGWMSVYWKNIRDCVADWVDNSSSDINVKNNISMIEDYDVLFDNLKPCRYKYNYGTSDRYHTGFIAQEVVEAIESAGLTTQDFAGVVHLEEPNENGSEWLLRRDEFVALNTWQIQKLKSRVSALEVQIEELKAAIK